MGRHSMIVEMVVTSWCLVMPLCLASSVAQDRVDPDPPVEQATRRTWPTFEPFMGSWAFAPTREERTRGMAGEKLDVATATTRVRAMIRSVDEIAKKVDVPTREGIREQFWWRTVPACIETMELLVESDEWDAERDELARACVEFFAMTKHAPELILSDPTSRQEGLWSLASWFQSRVEDPATYGKMIFTMYLGPYTGTSAQPPSDAAIHSTLALTNEIELRLLETDEAGIRSLAAYRGDDLLWARTLRFHDRADPVGNLEFRGRPPESLGRYGYRVAMSFGENVELYLDRDGGFLFYFLSW